MAESNNKDHPAGEVKNDGGLITGAALVGGTKLVYEAGKDLYSWFKPEQKLFIQLLDSSYIDGHHLVRARFASAYVHGIHIESIYLKDKGSTDIKAYKIHPGDGFGYGERKVDSDSRVISYPHLLSPNDTLDVHIKLPEQNEEKTVKKKGVNLVCTFSSIDKLDDIEMVSTPIRLRWA